MLHGLLEPSFGHAQFKKILGYEDDPPIGINALSTLAPGG